MKARTNRCLRAEKFLASRIIPLNFADDLARNTALPGTRTGNIIGARDLRAHNLRAEILRGGSERNSIQRNRILGRSRINGYTVRNSIVNPQRSVLTNNWRIRRKSLGVDGEDACARRTIRDRRLRNSCKEAEK
jgi:hypothetical protein